MINSKTEHITKCIYKLGVLALAAFLSWYFDSAWGCAALICLTYDN